MTLSARERTLSIVVGGAVFVLLNLLLVKAFVQRNAGYRQDLALSQGEWATMQEELGSADMWKKRDEAVTAKQPKLTNQNAAGVELLDLVTAIAKGHNISLVNKVVGGVTKQKGYKSVPVTVETHSIWPDLISFLYALQKPDQFIVCERVDIKVDESDASKMEGQFTIARWYAS